jgi:hypothetical protein
MAKKQSVRSDEYTREIKILDILATFNHVITTVIQHLISPAQTGLMQNRHINEGFLYTQNTTEMTFANTQLLMIY